MPRRTLVVRQVWVRQVWVRQVWVRQVWVRQVWMAASPGPGWRPRLRVGVASHSIAGSNQIVTKPRRLGASPWAGPFVVLPVGGVGLLMHRDRHAELA